MIVDDVNDGLMGSLVGGDETKIISIGKSDEYPNLSSIFLRDWMMGLNTIRNTMGLSRLPWKTPLLNENGDDVKEEALAPLIGWGGQTH